MVTWQVLLVMDGQRASGLETTGGLPGGVVGHRVAMRCGERVGCDGGGGGGKEEVMW